MNPLTSLPRGPVRRSLKFSIFDAFLWSIMFGLAENFIVPFALLFGATVFEVSFLQGATQMAVGLGQLTGGAIIERGGSRRRFAMLMTGIHGLSWVVIYWGTVLTGSAWVAIGIFCASIFLANLSGPAWLSWMNDLVPETQRGAFWSFRNSLAGLAQLIPIAAAGLALQFAKGADTELTAFGILFTLAAVARFSGVFTLAAQHEPPMKRSEEGRSMSFLGFVQDLRSSNFGRFVVFSILLNFTVQMIYPIIQVYLLKELGLEYSEYTWVMMTFTIASFVFMLYWGPLADRFGNRRTLIVSAALLPVVALAWVFVREWWWLVIIQLVSGFLISGINLSTANYIFDSVKPEKIAKSFAYFNTLNTGFAFLGALSGGALADGLKALSWHWGILTPLTTVFLVVAILRVLVLMGFARGFTEVRAAEPAPNLRWFYIYKPWQDASGWLLAVPRTLVKGVKTTVRKIRRRH